MKLLIVILATASCCLAAQIATIPAVPFEQSLPSADDAFAASSRIINGYVASANQFPHQASILITKNIGVASCGGSIISHSWVLTAAHCTIGGTQFVLRLGSLNMNTGGISQTVFRSVVHPQYKAANFDLALLPLATQLSFTAAILPVRLPTRGQAGANFQGKIATVSGWGATSNTGAAEAQLRWTNVRIIANSVCKRTFGGSIVPHVVCTEGVQGHQGTCSGDSGGPLVLQEGSETTLIGVVSFGASDDVGGCQGGHPSGYMRTASFLPWINQQTGIPTRF